MSQKRCRRIQVVLILLYVGQPIAPTAWPLAWFAAAWVKSGRIVVMAARAFEPAQSLVRMQRISFKGIAFERTFAGAPSHPDHAAVNSGTSASAANGPWPSSCTFFSLEARPFVPLAVVRVWKFAAVDLLLLLGAMRRVNAS